ncbi:hypothetical protein X777_06586 [Ooceraea biroi]|uniref:Uncharacterized protein n=1 Tax=Ooceraea biroi TaxID=2015173 RepID=A0A026WD50_OOCBI|nr:hypothetical protein X777_06586 [Ooceraea biroi]
MLENEVGGRQAKRWVEDEEGGREEMQEKERRSGDLALVREPTGRWNPRSRLIAIKAPLRLRL